MQVCHDQQACFAKQIIERGKCSLKDAHYVNLCVKSTVFSITFLTSLVKVSQTSFHEKDRFQNTHGNKCHRPHRRFGRLYM